MAGDLPSQFFEKRLALKVLSRLVAADIRVSELEQRGADVAVLELDGTFGTKRQQLMHCTPVFGLVVRLRSQLHRQHMKI